MTTPAAPKLILIDPGGSRTPVAVSRTPFTIGRLSDNDVLLRDSRISRRHAAIVLEGGHYALQDQNSRHGTYVNGVRIQGTRPLKNNDRIEFGVAGSYALLFVSEEQSLESLLQRVETPAAIPGAGTTSTELRSLNLLLEVGRSLQAGLTLDEVLATVVDASLKVTGTERGFIFLRDDKGELVLRVGRDTQKNALGREDFKGSMSVIRDVVRGSQDILVTNTLADEGVGQRASVVAAELRTIICLALRRLPSVGNLESTMTGFASEALGVLYLDSRLSGQPFSETDQQVLRSLALEAAGVIENARLFTAARDKERLDQELAIARDIQQALLPKRFRRYDTFQVAGVAIPSQQVGGDYYDLIEVPGGRHALVVADVCGKGISAALLTSTLQGALAAIVELGQPVTAVARQLNRYLCRHAAVNKFATFFCGLLEPDGAFQYVNAGHAPALLVPRAGDLVALRAESHPLGLFEEGEYTEQSVRLQPGDTLVLYTDGFLDAANPAGELYGMERLKKAVEGFRASAVEEMADALLADVREFARGIPPSDDMTLLVLRYEGKR